MQINFRSLGNSTHKKRKRRTCEVFFQWQCGFYISAIRLVGGSSFKEGRVEVYLNRQWGTVCDDAFDMNDAHVICRQLGYGGAEAARSDAAFGQGSGQIWLDDLACGGSETNIQHCSHNGWGSHNCGHSEDAGVVCLDGESGVVVFTMPPRKSQHACTGRNTLRIG